MVIVCERKSYITLLAKRNQIIVVRSCEKVVEKFSLNLHRVKGIYTSCSCS